jgi:hypothetical protein
MRKTAVCIVGLTALILLPFEGRIGGEILDRCSFKRRPELEIGGAILAALGVVALARTTVSEIGSIVAMEALFSISLHWRLIQRAKQLSAQGVVSPSDPRDLEGETAQRLFDAARELRSMRPSTARISLAMKQLAGLTRGRRATPRQSTLIVACYVVLFLLCAFVGAMLYPGLGIAPKTFDWLQTPFGR